ncbi:hypothetical protein T08_5662 [Trichinella sp. T8]|nr:hypothetical protein T08_5662 [Trichinella sp. T8]
MEERRKLHDLPILFLTNFDREVEINFSTSMLILVLQIEKQSNCQKEIISANSKKIFYEMNDTIPC